jgi:6-phosphofructokinase
MNVGIVTPGQIYPGVNVAVSEITVRESRSGNRVFGFFEGWRGLNYDLKEEIPFNSLRHDGGSILSTSPDLLDISQAEYSLRHLDKLYCIGDGRTQNGAANIATTTDVNTVGLLTSVDKDIGFGFNTLVREYVQKVKCAHTSAFATHTVFFVEVPSDDVARRVAMISPFVDVVITTDSYEDYLFDVQNAFAVEGKAVVVVTKHSPINKIIDVLHSDDVSTVFIPFDKLTMGAEPCMYDTVLAKRMVVESYNVCKTKHNFCKTATGVVYYEKNIRVM